MTDTVRTQIMAERLTDTIARRLTPPARGNKIHYDSEVKGFGIRITTAGACAFICAYRTKAGRERRMTIGSFPDWSVSQAREAAREIKRRVDVGGDPLAEIETERAAPTVADLCKRYAEEYLFDPVEGEKRPAKLAKSTREDYRSLIQNDILPTLKHYKVGDLTYSDVAALHAKITRRAPYRANRMASVLSRMLNLSVKWGYRTDNPVKWLDRNAESSREKNLSTDELDRLMAALAEHKDQDAADIFRMLLLTGSRRGETRAMRWDDLNFEDGVWLKPATATKQGKPHRIPLSAPTLLLLSNRREKAAPDAEFVFPHPKGDGHRIALKHDWSLVCKAANLAGVRTHDLRHTYASLLAGAGMSLPIIGKLLGHSQPQTTDRYVHFADDPLRDATERVGGIIVPIKRRG